MGQQARRAQFDLRIATDGLKNQVEADQRLVEVLWSYIRDNISPREQVRIETDLLNRGLGYCDAERASALRCYAAAVQATVDAENARPLVLLPQQRYALDRLDV